jgi:hypothetical protein
LADSKLSALSAIDAVEAATLLYGVDDPGGTPASVKVTAAQLRTFLFASTVGLPAEIGVAASDETTALTTGDGKATFRMPYAMTLTGVRASLTTASSSGAVTVNIRAGGTDVLSTALTIDQSELTSATAATPAVIDGAQDDLTADEEIKVDIDGAGTGAAGLKVWLTGVRA